MQLLIFFTVSINFPNQARKDIYVFGIMTIYWGRGMKSPRLLLKLHYYRSAHFHTMFHFLYNLLHKHISLFHLCLDPGHYTQSQSLDMILILQCIHLNLTKTKFILFLLFWLPFKNQIENNCTIVINLVLNPVAIVRAWTRGYRQWQCIPPGNKWNIVLPAAKFENLEIASIERI
jgi:hypothetical protein